jgi:hypothetical protein
VANVKKIHMKMIEATDITEQPSDKITKTLLQTFSQVDSS